MALLRRKRNALRVVPRAAGDDALGLFLGGELADFIVRAAHLKAAGHLQIFGFQINIALRVQARRSDQICFARDSF